MHCRSFAARFAPMAALCLLATAAAVHAADICPAANISEWRRSVVIAGPDKTVFTAPGADFSFSRAIGTILKSANLDDGPAARVKAVKSLIDTFKSDKATHPVDGHIVSVPVRDEKGMLAEDLLDPSKPNGMHPIGLFNRFDQAPGDAAYCGEHRIVFAQGDTSTNRTGTFNRFFLIFEAAVQNPRPDLGKEGCRPIAALWQSLKQPGLSPAALSTKLADFYFKGIPDSADATRSIQPVLHVTHFGNPFGQVRGNIFKQLPWQLREWHVEPTTGLFVMKPIGTNPEPILYTPPETALPADKEALRKDFQQMFLEDLLPSLTSAEGNIKEERDLINHIPMASARLPRFNDFVSNAHKNNAGRADDPREIATANGAFVAAINTALDQAGQTHIRAAHVLNRAGANSCGGCHQFSEKNGGVIGFATGAGGALTEIKWPASADFVHIREDSEISPLLTSFFLPDRCEQFNAVFFPAVVAQLPSQPQPAEGPATTLLRFNQQLRGMTPEAQEASRALRGQFITRERESDRAQRNLSGRIRQAD